MRLCRNIEAGLLDGLRDIGNGNLFGIERDVGAFEGKIYIGGANARPFR